MGETTSSNFLTMRSVVYFTKMITCLGSSYGAKHTPSTLLWIVVCDITDLKCEQQKGVHKTGLIIWSDQCGTVAAALMKY